VKIQNTLHQGYANLPSVQISIMNIWELKPKIYLLTCSSNKNEAKAANQAGVVNNNFVVDDVAGTIRESKFWFDAKFQDSIIDPMYLGNISVFRTYEYVNGEELLTPLFYINN